MEREELIRLLKAAAQPKPPREPTALEKLQRTPLIEAADKAALLVQLSVLDPAEQRKRAEEAMILAQRERRWRRILKQLHENG